MAFTHIQEVDLQVLKLLDPVTLYNVCRVNRYFVSLCQSDPFWKDRIEERYPGAARLREGDISLKEHYFNLRRIFAASFPADEAAALGYTRMDLYDWLGEKHFIFSRKALVKQAGEGKIDLIVSSYQRGNAPDVDVLRKALAKGHLHILIWADQNGLFPDLSYTEDFLTEVDPKVVSLKFDLEKAVAAASVNGFIDIVEWAAVHGIRPPIERIVRAAAKKGKLDLVKTFPPKFYKTVAEYAAEEGQIHILDYLKDKISFTVFMANRAAIRGRTETVKWLSQWVLPDGAGLIGAAVNGYLDIIKHVIKEPSYLAYLILPHSKLNVIKYLIEEVGVSLKGIDVTTLAATNGLEATLYLTGRGYKMLDYYTNIAAKHGHLDAVQWAMRKGLIFPSCGAVHSAAINGYVDLLDRLSIKPIRGDILDAIRANQGGVVRWAIEKGIYNPDVEGADIAAYYGNIAILELLGVPPSKEGVEKAIIHGTVRILPWLEYKGIDLKREWADLALRANSFLPLKWLISRGIHPSREVIERATGIARKWLSLNRFL